MFRIAIVDDESYVRMGLKTIAEKEGKYTVVGEADNGASAVQMIMQKQPNAVFLDITIPGLDGMEVLKEIRQRGYSGHVTMLTCHDEFRLVQQALRLGADDYVVKPFEAKEVIARVKAVLRRSGVQNQKKAKEVSYDGLYINMENYELRVRGKQIDTPPKEMELIYHLASNPNRVYTRDLFSLQESPRLGAGIMEMTDTTFPWTLRYDEMDYVISGRLDVLIGGERVSAGPGEVIYIPKDSSIQFSVTGHARFLYFVYPANWQEQA
mgnify:CR=1 FL=1